jgi:hypothetical protein
MSAGVQWLPSASSILAVLMFLMPFIVVSCPGQQRSVTGIQLVTGMTIEQPQTFGPSTSRRVPGETLAAVALVLAAAAAAVSFGRRREGALATAGLAGVAAVTLFLLKAKIDSDVAREGQGVVAVSFTTGFWLALLLLVISCGVSLYLARGKQATPVPAIAASPP